MRKKPEILAIAALLVILAGGAQAQSAPGGAVDGLHQAAERGDAVAQFRLGGAYVRGEGVPRDAAEAVRWFRKAAEQGNIPAQGMLGGAYASGEGVPKDMAEAVRWYRKAAEQGDAIAQENLAAAYHRGEGVPRDEGEAERWRSKAAAQRNVYRMDAVQTFRRLSPAAGPDQGQPGGADAKGGGMHGE